MIENNSYLIHLTEICESLDKKKILLEERLKSTHSRFNIFTTLLNINDEVRLHTRFLQEILNPAGKHDCNDLFLKLFFKTLKSIPPLDHNGNAVDFCDYKESNWNVGKEVRLKSFGQIDLLIETDDIVIAIENKIFAGEQYKQIERYAKGLDQMNKKQRCVLYLTIDGKPAHTSGGFDYLRISYKEHILNFLDCCLKESYQHIPVNQVLIQYKNIIQKLTNKDMEATTMKALIKHLSENPTIVKNWELIGVAIQDLKADTLDKFGDALIKALSGSFNIKYREDMTLGRFGKDKFGDLIISPQKDDFTAGHSFEIWIEHISKWNALVIGIEAKMRKNCSSYEMDILEQMNTKMQEYCKKTDYHLSSDDTTWGGTSWPLGWHDIISGFFPNNDYIAKMQDQSFFDNKVKNACEEIKGYIEILCKFYYKTNE